MLEKLIQQRTNLVLQRSQSKDVIEALERQLQVTSGQIAVLEALEAEATEAAAKIESALKAELESAQSKSEEAAKELASEPVNDFPDPDADV